MTNKEIKSEDFQQLFSALVSQTDIREYRKKLLTNHIEILESLFDSYFRKFEGFSCSHDKSAFVVSRIMKSLNTGEIYPLIETYDIEKYPQMKKHEGEVAYWCPTSIKDTDEAISFVKDILNLNFEGLIDKFNKVEGAKND